MRTTIIILLLVGSLAGTFYLFEAQERSAMNCYFGSLTPEEDEEELPTLHLNECYR